MMKSTKRRRRVNRRKKILSMIRLLKECHVIILNEHPDVPKTLKQLSNPPGPPSDKLDIAARERRLAWVFFFIVNNPEQNRNDSDYM